MTHTFSTGPVNNVLIFRQPLRSSPQGSGNSQVSISRKRLNLALPPPLEKYMNSTDGEAGNNSVAELQPSWLDPHDSQFCSSYMMESQIKDLQVFSFTNACVCVFCEMHFFHKRSVFSCRSLHDALMCLNCDVFVNFVLL